MSLVEMSHRGKIYDNLHNETISLARELLQIPEEFTILLLQGGATLQFGMVPMAFLKAGMSADYVITGSWAQKALDDARLIGKVNVVWDGKSDNYTKIPAQSELKFNDKADYVHLCSNETIGGIQWQDMPDTGNVPLIADMSSEIMSRPVPWNKLSMVYAGAQKNIAPSGVVLIIMKKSLIEQARKDLPIYLRYIII
jgi:phosphoserine aminotransferase